MREMAAELNVCLVTVKIMSYVHANVLNSMLFSLLWDDVKDMEADHKQLFFM